MKNKVINNAKTRDNNKGEPEEAYRAEQPSTCAD